MSPTLHCLGGRVAPDDIAIGLRTWLMLPAPCRERYWDVLLPNLAPEANDVITARVRQLVQEIGVTSEQLRPSLKACRQLFRNGARLGVSPTRFGEDCAALLGDELELRSLLQTWYEQALPLLRKELEESTLLEHGNVMTDLSWRVSMITHSSRGTSINRGVASLTFDYLDGKQSRRFTLNLTPEMVALLRDACEEITSPEATPRDES